MICAHIETTMDFRSLFTAVILLLYSLTKVTSYTTTDAANLYSALTFGYNNVIRPSGTTAVTVDFSLLSLNSLDVKTQKCSVTGWFDVTWTDGRFSWTPASYGNINEMFFSYSTCWDPKIIVDNLAEDGGVLYDSALMFRISNSGSVTWSPAGAFTVHCSMDVTYYPFDKQTCYLSVKSWAYDSSTVSLTFADSSISTDQYDENDDWKLDDTSLTSGDVTQNALTYSNLNYKLTFKRQTTTLLITFLLPFLLVSFLSMLVFAVPVECDAKLTFPLAVLVAETILMSAVYGEVPVATGKTPVFGMYLLVIVLLSILETLFTIVIIKLYYNKSKQKRVTDAAIRVAAILNSVTCFSQPDKQCGSGSNSSESPVEEPQSPPTIEIPPDFKTTIRRNPSIKSVSPDCSFATSRTEEFHTARRSGGWTDTGGGLCGGGSDRKYLWEDVSRAVDRFCFFVFLILRVVLFVVFIVILSAGAG